MLPPSRSLAADLGLARNTVAEAYAELVNEGWLASRQGAGTWVLNAGGSAGTAAGPRRAGGTGAQPDAGLTRRVGVSADRMGGLRPQGAVDGAHRSAANGRRARPTGAARCARRVPDAGPRRTHVGGVGGGVRGRPPCGRIVGAGLSRARPDRRRGLRAVHLPGSARGTGCADGADRRRRSRRGHRRTGRPGNAGGAADSRAPQPVRNAAARRTPYRGRRLGAAHRWLRLRRRLRRRVPLRPPADRRPAGVVPGPGGVHGIGEQEPVASVATGLDGVAGQPD